jgi:AcrR family transcriptional regulator
MAPGTSDRIADEAQALLLAEGADAVTMRRVAAAAGITPMAIYRHYPNREALLRVLADRGRAELASRYHRHHRRGNPLVQLRTLVNSVVDFALEQPRMYALLLAEPAAHDATADYRAEASPTFKTLITLIDEGMHRELLAPDDVWQVALGIAALMHGMISLHLAGRLGLSDPEFRVVCRNAITRALASAAL